jgi:hypothetical protein
LELEFAVRAVRYLLRLSALTLVGVAVFCGLVLLLNAQILLNRYAELYMMDADASSTPVLNRLHGANGEPATPPAATSDPERAGNIPEPQPAPPASPLNTERAAIHVNDAESIAGVAAADRRVDVILTRQPEAGAAFSEAVLENVKVLAIKLVNGGGERAAVHAVTLDVDSETIENLLLASRSGKLSLVLHRPIEKRPSGARQVASVAPTEIPPFAPEARQTIGVEVAASASVPAPDVAPAAMPEVTSTPPTPAPESPPANGADATSNAPPSATDVRPSAGAEIAAAPAVNLPVSDVPAANTPAAEPDHERFTVITINRVGGQSSIHRVPRER